MVRILSAARDIGVRFGQGATVLDLGTQEGVHGIEFAKKGAMVTTIEGRRANWRKVEFASKAIGLENIKNILDDITGLDFENMEEFDFVICSGILYHLPIETQSALLDYLATKSRIGFVVDSHFSFQNNSR